jgi:hypothetical protein
MTIPCNKIAVSRVVVAGESLIMAGPAGEKLVPQANTPPAGSLDPLQSASISRRPRLSTVFLPAGPVAAEAVKRILLARVSMDHGTGYIPLFTASSAHRF